MMSFPSPPSNPRNSNSIALRSPQPRRAEPPAFVNSTRSPTIASPTNPSHSDEDDAIWSAHPPTSPPTPSAPSSPIPTTQNSTEPEAETEADGFRSSALRSHPPSLPPQPKQQPPKHSLTPEPSQSYLRPRPSLSPQPSLTSQSTFSPQPSPSPSSIYTNPYYYTHTMPSHPPSDQPPSYTSPTTYTSTSTPPPYPFPDPSRRSPPRLVTAYAGLPAIEEVDTPKTSHNPRSPYHKPPHKHLLADRESRDARGMIPLRLQTSFSSLGGASTDGRKESASLLRGIPVPVTTKTKTKHRNWRGWRSRGGCCCGNPFRGERSGLWLGVAILSVAAIIAIIVGVGLYV